MLTIAMGGSRNGVPSAPASEWPYTTQHDRCIQMLIIAMAGARPGTAAPSPKATAGPSSEGEAKQDAPEQRDDTGSQRNGEGDKGKAPMYPPIPPPPPPQPPEKNLLVTLKR